MIWVVLGSAIAGGLIGFGLGQFYEQLSMRRGK